MAERAAKQNWTSRQLEAAVHKVKGSVSNKKERTFKPLVPKKGTFFTYRVIRPSSMSETAGEFSLDLGFRGRYCPELSSLSNLKLDDFVQAARIEKSAAGDTYEYKKIEGKAGIYTYKAKPMIFYDADTFWVDVDLGFRQWGEQKLRLRGIDTQELGAGGEKAARYVKKVLSAVPFIVITVSGRDKFGRPLTDVFYLPVQGKTVPVDYTREKVLIEGIFLNQELLDLGLAKRMDDD